MVFKNINLNMKYLLLIILTGILAGCQVSYKGNGGRERYSINNGWRFYKYESVTMADNLIYDVRPEVLDNLDEREADAKPDEAETTEATQLVLKAWILPTGNDFINNPNKKFNRPVGNPGEDFPFVQAGFDDSQWNLIDLPHDWAINGPFITEDLPGIASMGRLPSEGVAWYRRKLDIPASDKGKNIFLDVDGAMAYAMVWINGKLAGGWPYGYNSFRIDLTPYIQYGGDNQLAIRLDNPSSSSRWYPGGGIYRNVWITKTNPVHVGQWGTFITTRDVSEKSATIDLAIDVKNSSDRNIDIKVITDIFNLNNDGLKIGKAVASFDPLILMTSAGEKAVVKSTLELKNPRLWGPPPTQKPYMYVAVTTLYESGKVIDRYETPFGIRSLRFDAVNGIFVNDERIYINGVNQHHDLGALGSAFNLRAAERQLEMLRDMGCNAIRMAHNPPAKELLELTDRMGFLVVNEMFDVWERKKAALDFHLIFPEWHEQDLRAFIRRDRNHPSIFMWSFGNEVGEQYTGDEGAAIASRLHNIIKEEDITRPTTASMNYAKPHMPFPATMDVINLNYQGEGIRDAPAYAHLQGIRTSPLYPAFHAAFPDKVILSSENAAALSTRGTYLFPVTPEISAPVKDGEGGDFEKMYVSAYELYTANFGSSADKVLATKAQHPYVAGGFVWSGWDYLGEPTPYGNARSSYFGVIDLAGFKKDRFYLYQSQWRPDLPLVHILPHWNWPDRVGLITPVHLFTSGDEVELFLNEQSLGRKKKELYQSRLRWDDVVYEPGELKAIAYKNGKRWAETTIRTTKSPNRLLAEPDRNIIRNDGQDLSFVTIRITDEDGLLVPNAQNLITFSVEGAGVIVATDNGDPTDMTSFASHSRNAFNGYCLVIIKAKKGESGSIKLMAESDGLKSVVTEIKLVGK